MSQLKDLNTEIAGINTAPVESHKEFAAELNITYPLLADPTRKTTIDYGTKHILGFPARITFIIDKESIIRKIFTSHTDSFNLEEIVKFVRKLQTEAPTKDKVVN